MTRHSHRGRVRPLSILLLISALALATLAGACNGGSEPTPTPTVTVTESPSSSPSATPSPSPTAAGTTKVLVYFLRGEKLGVAERRVPATKAVATAALRALCEGPTAAETQAGLGTTVPDGTELLGVSIKDGVARVDLSSEYASGGGSLSMTARVAQVVYTATQFPTVKSVTFALDGTPVTTLGGEGIIVQKPQTRANWVEFEPPIFVENPGVGAILSSPFVLRGTASVFEGSFLAELRDDSGKRIKRVVVQASEGAPGRGTFRTAVKFATSATKGTLVVWEVSMEDGSRRNEVSIPVTFAK